MVFKNREEAGKKLAEKLKDFQDSQDLIVLAIPRGGLVIGKQLSLVLNCPLDILVTKKIGAPNNSELAIGAVGITGEPVINEELTSRLGIDKEYLEKEITGRKAEVERRVKEYRGNKPAVKLEDKIVIITDDGVATGATMAAAIEVIRQQEPKKIVVAIPVISRDSMPKLEEQADEIVYLEAPLMFFAVGQFYQEFDQVSDKEVKELLR
ncbi:MAG TPA: phosphoribosyltransferase [Patescibacteria group bacterium]|nr:phosphoribosyltransferase [Patescibacteria group bacterium]